MNTKSGFDLTKDEHIKKLKPYTFNIPIIMTIEKYEEMKILGQIIYKAISYMIENYLKYLHLMPRSEHDLKILDICSKYKGKVGTFRTDFVVDIQNNIKIIEMTTRQPLNGYFSSGFFYEIAKIQANELKINDVLDIYPTLFNYFDNYIENSDHICVIKGNEKLEEISIYPTLFEKSGIKTFIIPIEQLSKNLKLLENAWVIEELNFNEIRGFSLDIIEALAKCNLHNNIKSIFTTHDKRFYYVLNNNEFLKDILSASEISILKKYIVPTYVWEDNQDIWNHAYQHKNDYILKHQLKGKSVDIYAGIITEERDWKQLFENGTVKQMVLQNYIDQKKFHGFIGNEERNDYIAGTLLYFNQEFFGPGLYRTSSWPISNIKDFRKIAQLVASSLNNNPDFYYL